MKNRPTHHFFVPNEQIGDREIVIIESDVNHIKNVLRMTVGEKLTVGDGKNSTEYICEIMKIEENTIRLNIIDRNEAYTELKSKIYLFQGLPKSDKMELIIQKAVELGVSEIIPVVTTRTIVKLDSKKEQSKVKRWNGIAESAAKQSKRAVIPEVLASMKFEQALTYAKDKAIKLIPYELAAGMAGTRQVLEQIETGQDIAIFIGPEGGFAQAEIEKARQEEVIPISLGKRILRTETAGLTILSILMYYLEIQEA